MEGLGLGISVMWSFVKKRRERARLQQLHRQKMIVEDAEWNEHEKLAWQREHAAKKVLVVCNKTSKCRLGLCNHSNILVGAEVDLSGVELRNGQWVKKEE